MEIKPQYTFKKTEKLVSKRLIDQLFAEGKSLRYQTFFVRYLCGPFDIPSCCQLLISVPKKNIRTAVKRNLIKRRIRESYRLQKPELYKLLETKEDKLVLAIVYKQGKISEYEQINSDMERLISELKNGLK